MTKSHYESNRYFEGKTCADIQMNDLTYLANLIKKRNTIVTEITQIIGRPAQIGHVGEYIASQIFDIKLEKSASAKSIDGRFIAGMLRGCSVNIKYTTKQDNLLNLNSDELLDYYLVLTGVRESAGSSRGKIRPWVIESVFLFNAKNLTTSLRNRNFKIGIAASVKKQYWQDAEIYPRQQNSDLLLSQEQRDLLALFHP